MADSDSDDDDLMVLLMRRRHMKRRKKRRIWVHEILQLREVFGEFHHLVQELSSHDDKFFEYFRMSEDQFLQILVLVEGDLTKQHTNYSEPISAKQRLAIGLRFLTTGDSYKTIGFSYRVGKSTAVDIVPDVCDSLWKNLQPLFMAVPKKQDWIDIADGFHNRWQFPNCIGAIDGKHVLIQAPPNSGAAYFNYKKTFSIVLMALVDYMYRFTVIDVGAYGGSSDGGIFARSALGKGLDSNNLDLPADKTLPGAPELGEVPHVIVGDEAFPMKNNLMRPYPGRDLDDEKIIFNYRLSRSRRISENVFGLLAARFRIYHRRLQLHPVNIDKVIKSTCVLHNFLQKTGPGQHAMEQLDAELPVRNGDGLYGAIQNLQLRGNRAAQEALNVREIFKNYFNSQAGAVPWQRSTCFGQAE